MPGMWQTFDAEQDDDLVRALARQELQNRQGLSIAEGFENQRAGQERSALSRDTLEMNREWRTENADIRRARGESEADLRESTIAERNAKTEETNRRIARAREIVADRRTPEQGGPTPAMRAAADTVLLGGSVSSSMTDKPATKGVHWLGRNGTLKKIADVDANDDVRVEPAPPSATSQGGMSKYQQAQYARALGNDYLKTTKEFRTVKTQRDKMTSALSRWQSGATGFRDAAGQTILVSFQKTLDPDSVVRETEYARSEQGQPLADRLTAKWQQMVSGGPTVSDEALKEYVAMVDEFYKLAEQWARTEHDRISLLAQDAEIPMDRIAGGTKPRNAEEQSAVTPPAAPAAPKPGAGVAPGGTFNLRPKVSP